MNYQKTFFYIFSGLMAFALSGCLDDDGGDFTGNIDSGDQVIVQNSIFVGSASIDDPGWVVIHADNGSGEPAASFALSYPVRLNSAGRISNFYVPLDSTATISDGQEVWLALYYDRGISGEFELGGADEPVMVEGERVVESLTIASPSITISDQPVEDNTVVVDEVKTGLVGWAVIHRASENDEPGDVLGFAQITESPLEDLEVELTDTVTYTQGETLVAKLYLDNQPGDNFNPNADVPEGFGFGENNEIEDEFLIQ